MPNWCFTSIIFHGEKEEIEKLRSNIDEWTKENLKPNGFGPGWLGNILCGAGLRDRINVSENRIRCRGSLIDLGKIYDDERGNSAFHIQTETAWAPMVKMWDEIFKVMGYKSINFSFISEEEGMCEFFVYDPYDDFIEEDLTKYEKVDKSEMRY